MAVLVLVLYVNSPQVQLLYRIPWLLWFMAPCLMYWFNRVVVLANRGDLDMDPILFAFRDKASYCVLAALALIFLVAM